MLLGQCRLSDGGAVAGEPAGDTTTNRDEHADTADEQFDILGADHDVGVEQS